MFASAKISVGNFELYWVSVCSLLWDFTEDGLVITTGVCGTSYRSIFRYLTREYRRDSLSRNVIGKLPIPLRRRSPMIIILFILEAACCSLDKKFRAFDEIRWFMTVFDMSSLTPCYEPSDSSRIRRQHRLFPCCHYSYSSSSFFTYIFKVVSRFRFSG